MKKDFVMNRLPPYYVGDGAELSTPGAACSFLLGGLGLVGIFGGFPRWALCEQMEGRSIVELTQSESCVAGVVVGQRVLPTHVSILYLTSHLQRRCVPA